MSSSDLFPLLFLAGEKTWEMPQLPSLNKLPPRATLLPYPTADAALTLDRAANALVRGPERRVGFPDQAAPRSSHPGCRSMRLPGTRSRFPGNWTMQGFGKPHYTNVQMPFPNVPPDVPDENPTGIYRRAVRSAGGLAGAAGGAALRRLRRACWWSMSTASRWG